MGNGHNAHQNTRGMAVPFNSRRPVLTQSVGLVDVSVHYQGHRAQRTANGCLDQGGHYTIYDWQALLKSNGLEDSMSRRVNCHNNAVAESFFQLLKRERSKKKV